MRDGKRQSLFFSFPCLCKISVSCKNVSILHPCFHLPPFHFLHFRIHLLTQADFRWRRDKTHLHCELSTGSFPPFSSFCLFSILGFVGDVRSLGYLGIWRSGCCFFWSFAGGFSFWCEIAAICVRIDRIFMHFVIGENTWFSLVTLECDANTMSTGLQYSLTSFKMNFNF